MLSCPPQYLVPLSGPRRHPRLTVPAPCSEHPPASHTRTANMNILLTQAHFDHAAKVLKACTEPSLRDVIEDQTGCFNFLGTTHPCYTVGSRDHRYSEHRTAVVMRDFDKYRDASFFLEVWPEEIQVGAWMTPRDDVDHDSSLPEHDSFYVRQAILSAAWPGFVSWLPGAAPGRWMYVCDGVATATIPPQLVDAAAWATVSDFRLACVLSRAAFFALSKEHRGRYVRNAIEQSLAAVVYARPLSAAEPAVTETSG